MQCGVGGGVSSCHVREVNVRFWLTLFSGNETPHFTISHDYIIFAQSIGTPLFNKCTIYSSWISTYMLVGTAKECKSVGQAGSAHSQLVQDVIVELSSAVATKEGIIFPPGTIERLAAYTDVVSDFPCGVKEFQWRNKYFYDLGDAACPIHNGLLRECAARGKLGFELP